MKQELLFLRRNRGSEKMNFYRVTQISNIFESPSDLEESIITVFLLHLMWLWLSENLYEPKDSLPLTPVPATPACLTCPIPSLCSGFSAEIQCGQLGALMSLFIYILLLLPPSCGGLNQIPWSKIQTLSLILRNFYSCHVYVYRSVNHCMRRYKPKSLLAKGGSR